MSERERNSQNGPDPEFLVAGRSAVEMTEDERAKAIATGASFATAIAGDSPGSCLAIVGEFLPTSAPGQTADEQVRECLVDAFGYQKKQEGKRRINVLLESTGGSLDSAFKIVRYLTWYAKELVIYVPGQAKSASTLLALGAQCIYLSPFGELGPLDAQIPSPRNPTTFVSALDCYQSVDYVRKFGVETMSQALTRLGDDARSQIAFVDLIGAASAFGIGAIEPMLRGVRALDFGAWGRSLQIGEKYAQQVLSHNKGILDDNGSQDLDSKADRGSRAPDDAVRISSRLVYEFPHHKYFMDYRELKRIGLDVRIMSEDVYWAALRVLELCRDRSFIDFLSSPETEKRQERQKTREARPDKEEKRAETSPGVSAGGAEDARTPDGTRARPSDQT
jgi:Clp protease